MRPSLFQAANECGVNRFSPTRHEPRGPPGFESRGQLEGRASGHRIDLEGKVDYDQ